MLLAAPSKANIKDMRNQQFLVQSLNNWGLIVVISGSVEALLEISQHEGAASFIDEAAPNFQTSTCFNGSFRLVGANGEFADLDVS